LSLIFNLVLVRMYASEAAIFYAPTAFG
jgi:hypothetical protein